MRSRMAAHARSSRPASTTRRSPSKAHIRHDETQLSIASIALAPSRVTFSSVSRNSIRGLPAMKSSVETPLSADVRS